MVYDSWGGGERVGHQCEELMCKALGAGLCPDGERLPRWCQRLQPWCSSLQLLCQQQGPGAVPDTL